LQVTVTLLLLGRIYLTTAISKELSNYKTNQTVKTRWSSGLEVVRMFSDFPI